MGQKLLAQLIPAVEKMDWPGTDVATPQGEAAYRIGLARAERYRRDPSDLVAALRIFQSGQSRPYAYAGIAYTLLTAAREGDGSYDLSGLDTAMKWLEKGQALAPDLVEINFIEALVYIYGERYADARLILNYLNGQEPNSPYLLQAEIAYHQRQGEVEEAIYGYELAIQQTDSAPEKLALQEKLADCYFDFNRLNEALSLYQELVRFNREDSLLWHKMSIIHYRQGELKEAVRCNDKAVAIGDLPAAAQMNDVLKKQTGSGFLGRLRGRS